MRALLNTKRKQRVRDMGSKQTRPTAEMKEPASSRYLTYRLSVISAKKGLVQEVDIKTVSIERMVNYFNASIENLVSLSVDKKAATISIIVTDILTLNIPAFLD